MEQSTNLSLADSWLTVSPAFYQVLDTGIHASVTATNHSAFLRLRRLEPSVPSLTGYWPFDEGTTSPSLDFSRGGTPMEHFGGSMASGRFGQRALRFNGGPAGMGTRAWVSNTAYRVLPAGGEAFSISLWLRIEASTTGRRAIAGSSMGASNGWEVLLESQGPGPSSIVFAATTAESSLSFTGKVLLLPNRWHQLTITHDGQEGRLYLDSSLLAQGPIRVPQREGPIFFGGGVANHDSFLGTIDEVRTFSHCLSEEDISVTGYWRFNEDQGGLAADSSFQGQHAGVTDVAAWIAGREGSAVDLGCGRIVIRNDDFAVLPASGGSFSVSMWLRPNGLSVDRQELMACGNATNGWRLGIQTEPGGERRFDFCSTNQGGTLALSAPVTLTNGVWTKLDITYNGGIGTLYANGRVLGAASGAIRGTTAPLIVGASTGAVPFDGIIDELKIYSRERDASEIGPVARTMWETVLWGTETNIALQGFGPKGKPLVYNIVPVLTPTNGTLSHTPGSAVVSYQAGGRKGPDAFTYTVSDGEFTSPPTIVTLSVVQPHWLSPAGGPLLPADGSDPTRAWAVGAATALDEVWRTNSYYDCFFYAPGVYETKGWKWPSRNPAQPGCKHIGMGSSGPSQTTLKLVDALDDFNEGTIFQSHELAGADGFEVQSMMLDCNATNLPKSIRGEPVWVRIPLSTTGLVSNLKLHWADRTVNGVGPWKLGSAREFTVCARRFGSNTYCVTLGSTGNVDVIAINAEAEELFIDLKQRTAGVDFYSLAQVEVTGGMVSLPSAKLPDGTESRFDARTTIHWIADEDPGTIWTSGSESVVEIAMPLARGTVVNHLELNWNCQTIPNVGRLGPAAEFRLRARDENSGVYHDVPLVRHGRTVSGRETVSFGTPGLTNDIITDEVQLICTAKELEVAHYSLRDAWFRSGPTVVPIRIPTARSTLRWGANYSLLHAFDQDPSTEWTSRGPGMIGAIVVNGSNMKFIDLKVIGFGTHAEFECFPMVVGPLAIPGLKLNRGNVLVENCVFTQPAPRNQDGLTAVIMLAAWPSTLTNSVVRRCSVIDVASHFRYSHAYAALELEHSRAENCDVGVYFEPGAPAARYGLINIRSNSFINVAYGVHWLFHPGAEFDTIVCQGNEIVLNDSPGWGIAACDTCSPGPSGNIKGLTALNNIIRFADWVSRPSPSQGGILYSDISHGVIGNNVIALGTPNDVRVRQFPAGIIYPPPAVQDCNYLPPPPSSGVSYPASMDSLPPGYRRAWFNNRTLSGGLLDVRISNYGADGNASQQQWPE